MFWEKLDHVFSPVPKPDLGEESGHAAPVWTGDGTATCLAEGLGLPLPQPLPAGLSEALILTRHRKSLVITHITHLCV